MIGVERDIDDCRIDDDDPLADDIRTVIETAEAVAVTAAAAANKA